MLAIEMAASKLNVFLKKTSARTITALLDAVADTVAPSANDCADGFCACNHDHS